MLGAIAYLFSAGPAVWGPAALAGVLAGMASALFVHAYVRLLRLGARPDAALCMLALRVAWCRPLARYWRARKDGSVYSRRGCGWRGLLVQGPVWVLALSFGLLSARYGVSVKCAGLAVASVLLVNAAWLDCRIGLLPDALTYPLLWSGLALSWAGVGLPLRTAITGVFAGYLFLSLCVAVFRLSGRKDVLGGGDVKLLAGLGAWVGPAGLFVVLLVGCVASVVWAMWRQRTLRPSGTCSLGPFLVFPALCVLWLAPVAYG